MQDPDNPTYKGEQIRGDDTSSDEETVTVIVPVTDEANPFWTKVQARLPKEQSELDKHREVTGASKIDVSVVKFGIVIPGEVRTKLPDNHSYPKQVRDIYTSVLSSSSKDTYLQKATDNGYDKIAQSFLRTNMASEYKELVDSSGEDWLLTDDDCTKLNEAIKVQVGAVLTALGK